MSSFLTLHASQIQEFVDAVGEPEPAVLVKASPETRTHAIQALRAAGVEVPKAGAFTGAELDTALDVAIDKTLPGAIRRRMELKSQVYAAGLVLEKPTNANTAVVVTAGLMLKKAKIPAPTGKPYSVDEFDGLAAAADLSVAHRLEIKGACIKAGLVQDSIIKPSTAPPPKAVHDAKQICERLDLDVPAGKKLSVHALEAAMDAHRWDAGRRAYAKSALHAAGLIAA
jgi:hypothetical protein